MIGKKKHCEISGLRSVDVTIFLRYTPAKRGVFKSKYNSVKIIEKEVICPIIVLSVTDRKIGMRWKCDTRL